MAKSKIEEIKSNVKMIQEKIEQVKNLPVEFKTAHRWTLELVTNTGIIDSQFVKKAVLPKMTINNNEGRWEPIYVEYYDAISDSTKTLWDFVLNEPRKFEDLEGIVHFYSGNGIEVERWHLYLLPAAITFTDLDYNPPKTTMTIRMDFNVRHVLRRTKIQLEEDDKESEKEKKVKG